MINKSIFSRAIALCVCLTASLCVAQETPSNRCSDALFPNRLEAHYEVRASYGFLALEGDASLTFSQQGTEYALDTELRAMGGLSTQQNSRGLIEANHLLTTQYREKRPRRKQASVSVDWDMQHVQFENGQRLPTRPQLQDRASMLLQLFAASRVKPEATDIELSVVNTRHIDTYRFVRRESELLTTPLGTFTATRYAHTDTDDGDQLDVWFSSEQCGAPVRILVRNHKGYEVDQRIRTLRTQ